MKLIFAITAATLTFGAVTADVESAPGALLTLSSVQSGR